MTRTAWPDLPAAVHRAIAARTGPITAARDVSDGLTCTTAAILETPTGALFIKGVRRDEAEGRVAQRREAAVSPLVTDVAPRLRWRIDADGWELLVFDHIDGRHADLSPGSLDLPHVARALRRARRQIPHGTVPEYADRWAAWLDPDELELLRGEWLLHTDTHPHNILITPDRAYLVDWAMSTRGPAWVDVAYTSVRLMEDGHAPATARAWARGVPVWATASPAALSAWVSAHVRQWHQQLGPRDAAPGIARWRALEPAPTHG